MLTAFDLKSMYRISLGSCAPRTNLSILYHAKNRSKKFSNYCGSHKLIETYELTLILFRLLACATDGKAGCYVKDVAIQESIENYF